MDRLKILLVILSFLFSYTVMAQSNSNSTGLNVDSITNKITNQQPAYNTLSARAKLDWEDENGEQKFQASIRLKSDSLLWMSLGVAGIEGARVLITPDSFRLMNKLTMEYTANDFNLLRNWILFPVNFKMLLQIILGRKISIGEKVSMATTEDSSAILYLESNKLLEKIWVDTTHYTIQKILLKDKLFNQNMTITFEAYNYSEAKPFSYKRNIVINRDSDVLKLNMEFTKINFNGDLAFPFEVSEKYK